MSGRLFVLGAGLCWSFAGVCVKLAEPLNGWQIAGFRSLIAFLFLAIVLKPWCQGQFPSLKVCLLSLAYAVMLILFILANTLTSPANAIFLQDTAPIWVALISPFMVKEYPKKSDLLVLLLCILGIGLLFMESSVSGDKLAGKAPLYGNLLAVLSGIGFGVVIVGLRWGRPKGEPNQSKGHLTDSEQIVLWGNFLCFVLTLPFLADSPSVSLYPTSYAVMLFMGTIQLGLGYYFLTIGVARVTALESSLLILIEPAFNPIWILFYFGTVPSTWTLSGGAVILFALIVQAILKPR